MNRNQIKGRSKKICGEAREKAGKTFGSRKTESDGKKQRYIGRAQEAVGDLQTKGNDMTS